MATKCYGSFRIRSKELKVIKARDGSTLYLPNDKFINIVGTNMSRSNFASGPLNESQSVNSTTDIGFPFGDNRALTYNGADIEIRQYETNESELLKTGIKISLLRFASFRLRMKEIEEHIPSVEDKSRVFFKVHVGGPLKIVARHDGIDLREFRYTDDRLCTIPDDVGIHLSFDEWKQLKSAISELVAEKPEIANVTECFRQPNHSDEDVLCNCQECFHHLEDFIPWTFCLRLH